MNGSRCLVTGGCGFIGSHLVAALVERGAKVTVVDDLSTGRREYLPAGVKFVHGDIRNPRMISRSIRGQDYVFHLAAQVGNLLSVEDPLANMEINVGGSIRIFEAARDAHVKRIVYASSAAILGEAKQLPQDENHPLHPLSPYGASKLAAEQYGLSFHRVYGLPFVSLRFFNVYGPRQGSTEYGNVIPIFFRQLRNREPLRIYGDGRQTRDFTAVGDVVQSVLRAARVPRAVGEVFHIGTGKATSVLTLARTVQKVVGTHVDLLHARSRAGEVRHSVAEISKARRILGYKPRVTLKAGLRAVADSS